MEEEIEETVADRFARAAGIGPLVHAEQRVDGVVGGERDVHDRRPGHGRFGGGVNAEAGGTSRSMDGLAEMPSTSSMTKGADSAGAYASTVAAMTAITIQLRLMVTGCSCGAGTIRRPGRRRCRPSLVAEIGHWRAEYCCARPASNGDRVIEIRRVTQKRCHAECVMIALIVD